MDEIITLKLVTGAEIIGRLKEKTPVSIKVEKPVELMVSDRGLGFAPVCISIDDASEFSFLQDHILFSAPTRKELVDQYIKATTGIQLATSLK
jgi:hypothetical protein